MQRPKLYGVAIILKTANPKRSKSFCNTSGAWGYFLGCLTATVFALTLKGSFVGGLWLEHTGTIHHFSPYPSIFYMRSKLGIMRTPKLATWNSHVFVVIVNPRGIAKIARLRVPLPLTCSTVVSSSMMILCGVFGFACPSSIDINYRISFLLLLNSCPSALVQY